MHEYALPISVGVRYSGRYQRERCTRRSRGSTDAQGWLYGVVLLRSLLRFTSGYKAHPRTRARTDFRISLSLPR
jgi:hypothetical protein